MTDDRTEQTPKSLPPDRRQGIPGVHLAWLGARSTARYRCRRGSRRRPPSIGGSSSAALPGRRIALAAGRAPVRSNDTDYQFRADSDFVWLTGCQAEGAVLVHLGRRRRDAVPPRDGRAGRGGLLLQRPRR